LFLAEPDVEVHVEVGAVRRRPGERPPHSLLERLQLRERRPRHRRQHDVVVGKVDGDPVDGQTSEVYQIQVTGVQNTDIFSVFARGTTGTPMTLPMDFNANAVDVASADTIKAVLSLKSPNMDLKTKVHPQTTLVLTVKLQNCSQAAVNYAMSCE